MNMTTGKKLAAAFGAVVLVSLIGSATSIINFLRLNDANRWNVHSYKVLRTSDDMLASMVNMETGVRGFVVSGDEKFLDPYKAGKEQFEESFNAARELTADNAAQQQRLASLRQMRERVGEVQAKLIALRGDVSAGRQPESALTDYFRQGNDKD